MMKTPDLNGRSCRRFIQRIGNRNINLVIHFPPQHDVNFAARNAKYSGGKDPDRDPSSWDSDSDRKLPVNLPLAIPFGKGNDGGDDPEPSPDPDLKGIGPGEMAEGQNTAWIVGGIVAGAVFLGNLGLLVGWGWKKIAKGRNERKATKRNDKNLGISEKRSDLPITAATRNVRRSHPRDWETAVDP